LDTGVDIVEVQRVHRAVARWGSRFLDRIFTPTEQAQCRGRIQSLAARFAAKEAAAKVLGTGIGIVAWQDLETVSDHSGKPHLHLHGNADRIAVQRGLQEWSVSLSHTRDYAVAMVVAMATNLPDRQVS